METLINYDDPTVGSVLRPLSPLVAALERATVEDVSLLIIALARAERDRQAPQE